MIHQETKKSGKLWLIILPILCVLYSASSFYRAKLTLPSIPGFVVTHTLTTAGVWVVFYLLFLRRRRFETALIVYLILFASVSLGTLSGHWYYKRAAEQATKEIIAAIQAVVPVEDETQLRALDHLLAPESTQSPAATAGLVNLSKQYLRQLAASQVEYQQASNDSVPEILFQPSAITSREELSQAVQALERFQHSADKHKNTIMRLKRELEVETLTSGISRNRFHSVLDVFAQSFKLILSEHQQVIDDDQAFTEALLNFAQFTESRYGQWQVVDDVLVFDDPQDEARFNQLVDRVNELLEE